MEPQEEHNEAEKGKRNMEKLFDLQVFAQENTQTTGGLSAEMKTYYGMELLDNAKPQLVHNQFAATKPLPTGGGKTYIAASSLRTIFDAMPQRRAKAVVWLVPSEAILTQTRKALEIQTIPTASGWMWILAGGYRCTPRNRPLWGRTSPPLL